MNKAITDGLILMPPAFIDGLNVWSNQDGTPGSTTYDTVTSGTLVASDPDFGPCLELIKTDAIQQLRHTGETPMLPGMYLEVTARVKLMSGPFASVRIATYTGDVNGASLSGQVATAGPQVTLSQYGRIYTVRAIIGSGARTGVDMVWGTAPVFGHMGLDILGDNGAVVRVEAVEVRDMTSVFHRDMMGWIDVRDFGALGDGVTDDAGAFESADAAAAGLTVVIPKGTYFLGRDITMMSRCRFEGTVIQGPQNEFILRANFDYPTYVDAFGNETTALEKAIQALFNFADHESLDLGGRRIQLDGPVDIAAIVPNLSSFGLRRAIRNGQFQAVDGPGWDPEVVTASAQYSADNPLMLTNVENVESIAVGALVEGFGVGREVFVRARDVATSTLTLSNMAGRAQPSQVYTFTRERYILDFSGVPRVNAFNISDIEFSGEARANGVLLPPDGIAWSIRDCWFQRPRTRGITSIGRGCNGISIDRNQFIAPDGDALVQDRKSVAFNTNTNDSKIRNNRCVQFRHFAVLSGGGHLIVGNHFWQLDSEPQGVRTGGIIFTQRNVKTTITGNYIDAMPIELTNEHDPNATTGAGSIGFGNLAITGNIFTATRVPDWFAYIVIRPYGTGHRIEGLSVTNNAIKNFDDTLTDRIEAVDTSFGTIDHALTRSVAFHSNSYVNVRHKTESPVFVETVKEGVGASWTVDLVDHLPFGGQALSVESVVMHGPATDAAGNPVFEAPYAVTQVGSLANKVQLKWATAVQGTARLRVRSDLPS